MRIIGLCGGSGSGKGAVAKILSLRGAKHIDADKVYHSMVSGPSALIDELSAEFGDSVVSADGGLDRKALASIVFAEGAIDKQKKLNSITHKYVIDKIRALIDLYRSDGTCAVVVDAPLLFESGFDKECDSIICVIASKDIRISRIMARDGISAENAEKRIATQLSDEALIARCDHVIENNGSPELLEREVGRVADSLNIF